MEKHFCTCPAETCGNHPAMHGEGCDRCIQKNLAREEIPACFFLKISPEVDGLTTFTFADFAAFLRQHRGDGK